ncbi:hypothetical protein Poly30_27790 [Planctomycetes bacterium Poly30]|uniref:Uncharacterized protein n=1 Tax=Saltatorellus ferox TaxID=2528018 RepID=A0A518ET35_9BACT|nr:hypothetical protein Poly30_27790 [Planctomycetes bacterium Poly30]
MPNFFEVTPEDIGSLDDAVLRELICILARAELGRDGRPIAGVNCGGDQRAADGGIDVMVREGGGPSSGGFIPSSTTGIQVKAEKMSAAKVRSEMHSGDSLRPAIAEIAANGGAYIIASSRDNVSESMLQSRLDAMKDVVLGEVGDSGISLFFYDSKKLAQWTNSHPSMVAWVQSRTLGLAVSGWRPFGDWSSSPGELDEEFLGDKSERLEFQSKVMAMAVGLKALRHELRPGGIARLVGLSGVGKTRLAQALFDERIGEGSLDPSLAVYADLGAEPRPGARELVEHLSKTRQRVVLIADNCTREEHRRLAIALGSGSSVSLLTIEHDVRDDQPERTAVFSLYPDTAEQLNAVLQRRFPDLSPGDRSAIADFSGGNYRIGLALAHARRAGADLAGVSDAELLERLLSQGGEISEELRRTAETIALVASFDTEREENGELETLASLAELSSAQFFRNVELLRDRQLVQKRGSARALLPQGIAHRWAADAFRHFHPDTLLRAFDAKSPSRLVRSFAYRLGHLHTCDEAKRIASDWMCAGGPLDSAMSLSNEGLDLLLLAAPADSAAALELLVRTVRELKEGPVEEGRVHRICTLIRHLAYPADSFERCAELLIQLDAQVGSNTPAEALESMFTISLSGTLADPTQRTGVLKGLAENGATQAENLFFGCLSKMLLTGGFSSAFQPQFGSHARTWGYRPATTEEQADWFREVAALCLWLVEEEHSWTASAKELLASVFSDIMPRTGAHKELLELARAFAQDGGWPEGWVGASHAQREALEEGTAEALAVAQALEELVKALAPSTVLERVRVYALPEQTSSRDYAALREAYGTDYLDADREVAELCNTIGQELAGDSESLIAVLSEMLRSRSTRLYDVGSGLAQQCEEIQPVWRILADGYRELVESEGQATGQLLHGFMKALGERDSATAGNLLDEAIDDEILSSIALSLCSVVKCDEAGIQRLRAAIRLRRQPTRCMVGGPALRSMDATGLTGLIEEILALENRGHESAIEICFAVLNRLESDEIEEGDWSAFVGVGREMLSRIDFDGLSSDIDWRLASLANWCFGEEDAAFIDFITQFAAAVREGGHLEGKFSRLVRYFTDKFPYAALDALCVGRSDSHSLWLREFDSGRQDGYPLDEMGVEVVLGWAGAGPGSRYLDLLCCGSLWSELAGSEGPEWFPVGRLLLRCCPDKDAALKVVVDRLRAVRWSGSQTDSLRSHRCLLEVLLGEDHALSRAASDALGLLDELVRYAQQADDASNLRRQDARFYY